MMNIKKLIRTSGLVLGIAAVSWLCFVSGWKVCVGIFLLIWAENMSRWSDGKKP